MKLTHTATLAVLAASSASYAGGLGLEPIDAFPIHSLPSGANGVAIAVTESGDRFFAGSTWASTVMPPDIVLIGSHRGYVAKYAADGTPVFAKMLTGAVVGAELNRIGDIAVMPDGGAAMVGFFDGTIQFGSHTLVSGTNFKIWVTRLSANGEFLWATQATPPATGVSQSRAHAVATDAAGNIYLSGFFTTDFLLGPSFSLLNATDRDGFLVKLSPDGSVLWGVRVGGAGNQIPRGVAVDQNGDVFVSGEFTSEAEFSPTVVEQAIGTEDVFLAKYSGADGSFEWAKVGHQVGTRDLESADIGTDADGNVYISGAMADHTPTTIAMEFGGHTVVGRGSYLVKYTSDGEVVWARSGCERCEVTGMDVNAEGIIVLSAVEHGVIGSDSGPTVDFGSDSGGSVVARFNSDGELRQVVRFHGATSADVAINDSGLIGATGSVVFSEEFGDATLTADMTNDFQPSAWVSLFVPGVEGDANADGIVNFADINLLLTAIGTTSGGPDLNLDGVVDFTDLNLVLNHFGAEAP